MSTTIGDPSSTSGRLIAASNVNGTSVYNPTGEKLGSIHDVMLDKMSGEAEFAILSFGGFLGMGEKYHPLPWNSLRYDVSQGGYVVNLDRDRLERAPAYSADEISDWDDTWDRRISEYWM